METRKHVLAGILCALLVITLTSKVEAKSVFAITKHSDSTIKAYSISGDQIEFMDNVESGSFGNGAVGICVWESKDLMFVTYETSEKIAWASTKTLQRENDDKISAEESNLAGIIADEGNDVLYVVTRDTKRLYTYSYDGANDTLALVHPNDPCYPSRKYRPLEEDLTGAKAYGLVLDEQGGEDYGLLYVADGTENVYRYNTTTWQLEDTIGMGQSVICVGVDSEDYLYAGGHNSHTYLMRYDLNGDPNNPETLLQKNMGANITDVKICQESGLVYTTTRRQAEGNLGTVEVYDPCNWTSANPAGLVLTDTESGVGFGGPAGIAVGAHYKPAWMVYLDKDDGLDPCDPCSPSCYAPGDEFTYTITYGHNGYNHEWVEVTDLLPRETTFLSSTPLYNEYDPEKNSYFWALGSLTTNDPNNNIITIDVLVNEMAEPNSVIINTAIIETDIAYKIIKVYTPICCWEDPCSVSGVIYVNGMLDPNSTYNTGTSWENAYVDLQSALWRAGVCGAEIWVAMDTYSPGNGANDTFKIPDNVEVYGGFIGDETSREQRDFVSHKTYLTGYISEELRNYEVVTMGDNTVLDGFIIKDGLYVGVVGENVDFKIANCIIRKNGEVGISCENGNVIVDWCVIKDNEYHGIYSQGANKTLSVSNCKIYGNNENGIYCYNSTPTVINSMIHHNGSDGDSYYGIKLYQPSDNPDIRNNTIVYNQNEGIYFTGNNEPDINNCILWYNNEADDLAQLAGCGTTYYSCVTDPNNLPGSGTPDGNGNINCDPCFAYSDPDIGNFHLDPDSECIDRGDNSVVEPGEYDIDGDDRIVNGGNGLIVDMGADEMACEDITHPCDFNHDGIINLIEFADLSRAWLLDDNDPNWADTYVKCDFHADGQIDILDLREFAEVWLWQACYRLNGVSMLLMGGGGGMDKTMSAPAIAKMPTRAEVERGRIAKWRRNCQPSPQEQFEVTEKLLNDGTKIAIIAYSTGEPLAEIVTDPRGNITHFIVYLDNGNRVEINCTYDSIGNETSAVYTHYDADGNIILVEIMEDDMLLTQDE